MDVFLLLLVLGVLVYLFVRAIDWAFHIDRAEWRQRERLRRRQASRINKTFEDIIEAEKERERKAPE